MSEPQEVMHRYPDGLPMGPPEVVKIEKNSKGHNIEVKATSVARALELYDQTLAELAKRGA